VRTLTDAQLLEELEPVVAGRLDRHLAATRDWLPHEYVPWSRGRDFAGEGGAAWAVEQSALAPAVRAAFELNLLTEDNLPSYHREIAVRFGRDGAWGTWVHRWTAEEGRHAMAIRDYLLVSRGVDPAALERDRMASMQAGFAADGKDMLRSIAYVSLQELATRIAHRNTGRLAGDPAADRLLARIATDENLHMVFYRDVLGAALELAPDQALEAVAAEAIDFRMPGHGVPGFLRRSVQIAEAGIYDARIHRDQVIAPLLRHWGVLEMRPRTAAAARAQSALAAHLEYLEGVVARAEDRRDRRAG
jgi:acyl-[acyl-carrier protein] desaturase